MVNPNNDSYNDLFINGYQQPAIIHRGMINLPAVEQESVEDNRVAFRMFEEMGRAAKELILKVRKEEEEKREMIRRHEATVMKRFRVYLLGISNSLEGVFDNLPPLPVIKLVPDKNEVLARVNKVLKGAIEGLVPKLEDEKEIRKVKGYLRKKYGSEQKTEEESNDHSYQEESVLHDIMCVHCTSASADVVWLCAHLYLCFFCDRSFKVCPACNSPPIHKLPLHNHPEDDS